MREHAYGLATQNFHEWLVEQGIALGVNVLMLAPALAALYALIRRASRAWWAWGGALAVCFFAFSVLIAPVYV